MKLSTRASVITAALSAFALTTPLAATASAHAIIQLNGVSAVAGKTSAMTLEIQHGCLPSESTVQVEAFVGKPWRAVKPQAVPGWTSSVTRQAKGGWHITWVNQGAPIPFGTATFFPITVAWPKNAGTYGMSVMQLCTDGATYYWNEKYTPATATADSPPLTPKPEVLVVEKQDSSASTTSTPSSTTATQAHKH
jgi:uncharacterized protein YcnI